MHLSVGYFSVANIITVYQNVTAILFTLEPFKKYDSDLDVSLIKNVTNIQHSVAPSTPKNLYPRHFFDAK
jgi:hypothetical protein